MFLFLMRECNLQKGPPGAKADNTSQDTEIICNLIESGANIELKNDEGKTPLDFANDDMVRQFMKT